MSIEAMWYASYDENGNPPKCNRLTRLPYRQQLGMAFDLALDFRAGRAGYRSVGRISTTGETYWWWPRENVKHGDWWLLPPRTITLMERATRYAEQRASEPPMEVSEWWLLPDNAPPSAKRRDLTVHERIDVILLRLQRAAHRAQRRLPAGYEPPPFTPLRPYTMRPGSAPQRSTYVCTPRGWDWQTCTTSTPAATT